MTKVILPAVTLVMVTLFTATTIAQTSLAPDQNPRYMESQQKYMKVSDSVNTWHSTTLQDTYKAIDFLADKQEARDQRRAFRRQMRMERARWGWDNGYYDNYNGYGYPGYYNNNYNNNGYYRPYGFRNNLSNYFWNTLPIATGIGLASWWWK